MGAKVVGSSRVARDFFAARYAAVVARTFDAPAGALAEHDVAFAVGALTFVGRRDDAQACFDAWRARATEPSARTLAAARFFLGLSLARAGQFEAAHAQLVANARTRLRQGDAWAQAFAWQGLAAHRYFTGRYQAAARHALRALRAAHVAGFSYLKLLANDLRGHALVQLGRMSAGIALLEQAKRLAQSLGSSSHAFAIDCSIASYSLRFRLDPELLRRLERLLEHPSHDSYSRHALLTEYAAQLALRGRGVEARDALAQADGEALKRDVRRGNISNLLAHLHVARFSRGAEACGELLSQAGSWVDDADVAFRAELLGFEALVARARSDSARLTRAVSQLRQLSATHELHVAKALLEQLSEEPYQAPAFAEDRRTPLLRAVAQRDQAALPRLLASGLLGAVPELLGAAPARRIWVLVNEDSVLLEDCGEVRLRSHPPGWLPRVLQLLSLGDVPKETLVSQLWGLKLYRPERHDPLLRTTIHRLRSFIEPYGAWVRVTSNGYGASVPVLFVGGAVPDVASPIEPEEWAPEPPREARVESARAVAPPDRVARFLEDGKSTTAHEVARALDVSESTALRLLRELVKQGRVRRSGFARATRYRAAAPPAY